MVKGNDRQMDGKSVWRFFSEKIGKKFELLPAIIEKIWNDHKRGKCKLYQDIKLGGGSYEHEKMLLFVLIKRIYDVGFAGNVR